MARHEESPEKFEAIASQLAEASERLNALAKAMRESGIPHALIHGTLVQNQHLPAVLDWSEKTNADVRNQIRAYLSGVASSAEQHKERNQTRKMAAAKKPTKKKPT